MKLNQDGGSKTDTLIKLVLVFFLSLLSFSVGTYVGKQFSDSQHRVADLENESDRVVASIPGDVTKAEPNQAITEEEISKLSDDFVKKERQDAGVTTPEKPKDVKDNKEIKVADKNDVKVTDSKTKKVSSIHDEIADVTKRIAEGMKVEAPKPPVSRVPTSYPKQPTGSAVGKFTVQLSAHESEDEAKIKAQEYRDKGYSAFYFPGTVKGKSWYRVGVGQFTTSDEAKKYKDKEKAFSGAIIQKITQ